MRSRAVNDQALSDVRAESDWFGELAVADFKDPARFHDVAAAVHRLCGHIAAAERCGVAPEAIRDAVKVAWEIHGRSPSIRRLQTWPRGYPGDFETIECLMGQRVQAPF